MNYNKEEIKNDLFSLVQENRATLQIPDFWVTIQNDTYTATKSGIEEKYPKEWFIRAKCVGAHHRRVFGKEQGFLFLSREGWEANKEIIKETFEESKLGRYYRGNDSWDKFVEEAEKFLDDVDKTTEKYREKVAGYLKNY